MKASAFSKLGQRTTDPAISWLMKMTLDHPHIISLAAGFTDDWSLPVEETRELLNELLASSTAARAALQYGSTLGDATLRRLTIERLRAQDRADVGGQYTPERAIITHGSQQLLYIVTECLCDSGDIILVEDPTYFVYLGIVQSHGLQCRGIPLEADGIDLIRLEHVLESLKRTGEIRRVKMLYLVSYFQNPSGVTTSYQKKVAALKLLRRYEKFAGHPIFLLEDAAYRELRFSGPEIPSALAEAKFQDRVIYAGTFSKPFATGIRVGYGLLPRALFDVAARVKGNHDFGTSNLLQQILATALQSRRYDAHLSVLQQRYQKKAKVLMRALQQHFPQAVEWRPAEGGLYIWARLARGGKSGPKSTLFETALARDVLYVPGELCYASDRTRPLPRNEMRLSFGGATDDEIREGIKRLGSVLRDCL
jgi:2-aminoadipate transaminase